MNKKTKKQIYPFKRQVFNIIKPPFPGMPRKLEGTAKFCCDPHKNKNFDIKYVNAKASIISGSSIYVPKQVSIITILEKKDGNYSTINLNKKISKLVTNFYQQNNIFTKKNTLKNLTPKGRILEKQLNKLFSKYNLKYKFKNHINKDKISNFLLDFKNKNSSIDCIKNKEKKIYKKNCKSFKSSTRDGLMTLKDLIKIEGNGIYIIKVSI